MYSKIFAQSHWIFIYIHTHTLNHLLFCIWEERETFCSNTLLPSPPRGTWIRFTITICVGIHISLYIPATRDNPIYRALKVRGHYPTSLALGFCSPTDFHCRVVFLILSHGKTYFIYEWVSSSPELFIVMVRSESFFFFHLTFIRVYTRREKFRLIHVLVPYFLFFFFHVKNYKTCNTTYVHEGKNYRWIFEL